MQLFYARTKEVIKEVMEKGSCDAKKHPNPLHHEKYFPNNGPQWLETWDLGNMSHNDNPPSCGMLRVHTDPECATLTRTQGGNLQACNGLMHTKSG